MGSWNGYSGEPCLPTLGEMRHAKEGDNKKLKKETVSEGESDEDLV
jgi:hypothetical protein